VGGGGGKRGGRGWGVLVFEREVGVGCFCGGLLRGFCVVFVGGVASSSLLGAPPGGTSEKTPVIGEPTKDISKRKMTAQKRVLHHSGPKE